MKKKIVYVDMDNVLVDFRSALDILKIKNPKILEEYKDNEDEITSVFSKMEPMKGAIEAFNFLAANFDTYILSTAPWNNPSAWSDKLNWVKKYFGESAHKRLILTHHKNLNKGDFLIDDRDKNGAAEFEGELIKLGPDGFPDWDAVIAFMKSKIE